MFNFRNFWDGRARNEFNGVNPIGDLDPFAQVWLNEGGLHLVDLIGPLRLENSSLASQAVGPPLSDMEMSFRGRTFVDLGLTEAEKDALVALMEAMTDERVRLQQAPFDHPQLFLPNLGELRAVGANGSPPLPTFFENLAP